MAKNSQFVARLPLAVNCNGNDKTNTVHLTDSFSAFSSVFFPQILPVYCDFFPHKSLFNPANNSTLILCSILNHTSLIRIFLCVWNDSVCETVGDLAAVLTQNAKINWALLNSWGEKDHSPHCPIQWSLSYPVITVQTLTWGNAHWINDYCWLGILTQIHMHICSSALQPKNYTGLSFCFLNFWWSKGPFYFYGKILLMKEMVPFK